MNLNDLQLLADILLSCRWTRAEHDGLRLGYTKRNPGGTQPLLDAIHSAYPFAPSHAQLIRFLYRERALLRGMRWKRLPDIAWDRRLVRTQMNPAKPKCDRFDVPDLPTVGFVAEQLLHLPAPVVEWLERWRTKHYLIKAIAKRGRSGVPRIIEQPKRLLKAAQRDILREILRWVPAHPAAHGFVARRSVLSFTREHIGRAAVLRLDLENFFPSIGEARVSAIFRTLGYPPPVARLLTSLCTTGTRLDALPEFADCATARHLRLRWLYSRPHLPQGAPTSPHMANLVAYRLDARLSGLAKSAGCQYTRYADDLLFSGDKEWQRQAEQFKLQVAAIVLDEGFRLNYRKTRLMPQATRQLATGVVLNSHANVDRRQSDLLKATLHNCVRFGPRTQNHQAHANFHAHLLGRINWIRQLNPGRADKLMRVFNEIKW